MYDVSYNVAAFIHTKIFNDKDPKHTRYSATTVKQFYIPYIQINFHLAQLLVAESLYK